jgi:hypothetical protein
MKSFAIKSLVAGVLVSSVSADSNFGGDPTPSPYYYSEINSVEYCSDADERPSHSDFDDMSDSASVVSSSLVYEGGCFVSSQAMMCHGGEDALINSFDFDSDEDVDSDDEDDDEDDGHSSMLSNASLYRSKTLAGGPASTPSNKGGQRQSTSAPVTSYFEKEVRLNQKSTIQQAVFVRGGAGASVDNELAKKLFVAAITTLVFEGCIGHVLEFFKIVMQTSPAGITYGKVFNDITSQKGTTGLWDGFAPWGVIQAVLKGGVFGLAHATATKLLVPVADDGKIPMALALTMAGGIGGGFQGYVLSPTLLMKTRVMTNPVFREQMSLLRTTWLSLLIGFEVVKNEGFMTLMKGANVFATKRVLDWSSRYFFADSFEAAFLGIKGAALSTTEKSISSLLGGVASTIVTLPLDVLVAKTQDAKKAGVKVSPFKMFKDELDEVGWSGLKDNYMRGFEARLIHVCLTTVVIKTGSPIVYDLIFGISA